MNIATQTSTLNAVNYDRSLVIGRTDEITRIVETLLRINKPNVIITGEPGVGKTALVNHLAHLIANRCVPNELCDYTVHGVNTNDLISGPGYRGDFENRIKGLLDSASKNGKVILFIDEIHTAESLGQMANNSTPGLGNTLKPYITSGKLRVIGATTNEEYEKIKDGALLRRFRRIEIGEPTKQACYAIIDMLLKEYNTRKTPIEANVDEVIEVIYNGSLQMKGYNPDKITDICDLIFAKSRIADLQIITMSDVRRFVNEIIQTIV
jgi:ATP-dependent Clp protease ATP-binding subunit ClpA